MREYFAFVHVPFSGKLVKGSAPVNLHGNGFALTFDGVTRDIHGAIGMPKTLPQEALRVQ
jgi:hypothetical protein